MYQINMALLLMLNLGVDIYLRFFKYNKGFVFQ